MVRREMLLHLMDARSSQEFSRVQYLKTELSVSLKPAIDLEPEQRAQNIKALKTKEWPSEAGSLQLQLHRFDFVAC